MAKQRRWIAPLFNSEQLLSKAIPELVGSGFNLRVQLTVQYSSFDQLQCPASKSFCQVRLRRVDRAVGF